MRLLAYGLMVPWVALFAFCRMYPETSYLALEVLQREFLVSLLSTAGLSLLLWKRSSKINFKNRPFK